MTFKLVAATLAMLSLSGCATDLPLGQPTPGSSSYFLSHAYVGEAKRLGDLGFASVRAGDGAAARAHFERSTATLADGVARHRVEAADRAEVQQTIATVGMVALAVAGALASGQAAANARTPAQMNTVNRSLEQFTAGLLNLNDMVSTEIRAAEAGSVAQSARRVQTDAWRTVVVSDDPVARSVVRIHNRTSGGWCTGFFVSPWLIMTSAHCFNIGDALQAYRQTPSSGRELMRGEDEEIPIVHQYSRAGYDYSRRDQCIPDDMALLLTKEPSAHFMPVSEDPPSPGDTLMVMGYSGDLNRGFFLRLDYGCTVVRGLDDRGRFVHDCASYGGNSGGPVLRVTPLGIAAIGAHSCGTRGATGGTRDPTRIADSVTLARGMIAAIRERPEAQGKMASTPF